MQTPRFAHLGFILCLFGSVAEAQSITGFTTVDVDPATGYVTATCQTDVDPDAELYYNASVSCTLYDGYGTTVATGSDTDVDGYNGYAQTILVIPGIPGTVYKATGFHSADSIDLIDPNEPVPEGDFGLHYYDFLNFGFFEGQPNQIYPSYFNWLGPGPQEKRKASRIRIGATKDSNVLYLDIPPIIRAAQRDFSVTCDQIFQKVIPNYTNANFFTSLLSTQFNQWPAGTPNAPPDPGSDASTEMVPGRPIDLWRNFYSLMPYPTFREFVLIHEGVHHYTGWTDDQFITILLRLDISEWAISQPAVLRIGFPQVVRRRCHHVSSKRS